MPRGDRTGPWGRGPRTGRGLGYCSGYDEPGFTAGAPGRAFHGRGSVGGMGFGRGAGRGYGRGIGYGRGGISPVGPDPDYEAAPSPPEAEENELRSYMGHLENEIRTVKERLKVLRSGKKE